MVITTSKMRPAVTIISPSINRDKAFRERLRGSNLTSDKELMVVIREAFSKEEKNGMFTREGGGSD